VLLLSPWDPDLVRGWVGGVAEVVTAPQPPAPEVLRELVPTAEVVIGDQRHLHRLDRSLLETMRSCRLIQMPSVGFDVVDHRAAAELGIAVANAAGYNRDAVADWVVMAILNLLRDGAAYDRSLRAGDWARFGLGRELGSLTVGIVGLGNVGSAVAARVSGFGARVLFCDVIAKGFLGARQASFTDLCRESDVVTVHVPLDHDTRHLVDAEALALMKPGAILVNASRGPVVDESALVAALRERRIAAAALDVYEVEPLPRDSPLRALDNVFITPHVGGATSEAQDRVFEIVKTNVLRALAGEALFNVVNAGVREHRQREVSR
jgi:phosphoglycerate dehydrogenase-like enzyme